VCVGIHSNPKSEGSWFCESSRLVLELMIPPTYWLGSVVETHASRVRESPGLPGSKLRKLLAYLAALAREEK